MSLRLNPWFAAAVRFVRDERGGPAAEFAITLPILAAVVLATLQVGVIFIAKAYLETGAEQAARTVMTNNAVIQTGKDCSPPNGTDSGCTSTPMTQAQFQAAVCAEMPALFTCNLIIVQLQQICADTSGSCTPAPISTLLPTFKSDGTLKNATTFSTGSSGSLMLLTVMYQWPVYGGILGLNWGNLGNGKMLMTSTQIFKVET
jgi:Flp pilus assembly protein TadG